MFIRVCFVFVFLAVVLFENSRVRGDLVYAKQAFDGWQFNAGAANSIQEPIGNGPNVSDDGVLYGFDVTESMEGLRYASIRMQMQLLENDTPEGWVFYTGIYNNFDIDNFTTEFSLEGLTLDHPSTAPDAVFQTSAFSYSSLGVQNGISNWEVEFSLLETGWVGQLGFTAMASVPFDPNDGDRIAGFALTDIVGGQAIIDRSNDEQVAELLFKDGFRDVAVDVAFQAVPEPGSFTMLGLFAGLATARRRRR